MYHVVVRYMSTASGGIHVYSPASGGSIHVYRQLVVGYMCFNPLPTNDAYMHHDHIELHKPIRIYMGG